ncbi:aminopeptidase [Asanoa ishikariensis]|uniref:Aminopeptidase N n=1 Tax=Asanoa ishikariensis TaxID=137265 RepID=A0A1H3UZS8_9ACTN|nr:aminopeptidase N [Asanoa ishikariensis]GIF70032.1 aminopeptidase [Asanoa ishikariensis]SDZ67339.1 aminopeptidase N [Asanoa ishikariensis]
MSLTLNEARARAAMLSEVSYDLTFDVTSPDDFRSQVAVRFDTTGGDTFLELHQATSIDVTVDGETITPAYDEKRITLEGLTPGTHEVVVDARLRYVTDGEGMHTFTDPVDGERYVGGYLGLDITQRLFACFDQLDLKAPITVTVLADPEWTVLSNGRLTKAKSGRFEFATTPPIPCDLLAVAAGPYASVTWEHRGVPMGWHARRSLAAELNRDAAELRRVTEVCFDHYAKIFTEPFPFDSYDQVFVPDLNWGAMECPGCVTWNELMLPRGRVTDDNRRRRAMVVAHEMSHMWFADLVSPVWWEDAWLNESFADYMGFEVAEFAAGYAGTRVSFEAAYKPGAYLADRRRSTHPVAPAAQDVPDVDTATTIFDRISYGKGNAVLRQLVTWLGTEDFLSGVNAHLTRHRFANATLEDLLSALDAASPRDVRGWAQVWLRQSGHDTIKVSRAGDVPVFTREGVRPHRFTVAAYTPSLEPVGERLVDLADEPVALPEWAGLVVVPNAHGETFARIELDPFSYDIVVRDLAALSDPLVRAVLWATLLDQVPPAAHLDLVARQLPRETSSTLVAAALDRTLKDLVRRALPPSDVPAALEVVAAACKLDGEPDEQRAIALAGGLAWSTSDAALLRRWLAADATDQGLALDPALRWATVRRLAELGGIEAAEIEAERLRDGTAGGDLGAVTALAARPTAEAKAEAWAAMTGDVSVSRFRALAEGLWTLSQRELVTPYVAAYVAAAPALARRGSAFAAVVGKAFPAFPLTSDELDLVRDALRGDIPAVLRREWEDELDDRAA